MPATANRATLDLLTQTFTLGRQVVLCALACSALFYVWRRYVAPLRFGWIITFGFLARAFAAQILFWISYLRLPVAIPLQRGGGIWFFGTDALYFFTPARRAASMSLRRVLTLDPGYPSVIYTKLLGVFVWLFGQVTSVGLLLNLFAFLGTSLLIVAWARRGRIQNEKTVAVALMALSFTPTWILWSLQPLKDPFFILLVVLYGFTLYGWMIHTTENATAAAILDAIILVVTAYCLAGIRWYFALILMSSAALPMLATALRRRGATARLVSIASALIILVLSSQAIVEGGAAYLPERLQSILRPGSVAVHESNGLARVVTVLEGARDELEFYQNAGTRIGAGPVIVALERGKTPAPTVSYRAPANRPRFAPRKKLPPQNQPISNITLPVTHAGRLIAGFSTLYLPRFVIMPLGLVTIGGGRGFWWFAEFDTLIFMLVCAVSVAALVRSRRIGSWRHPMLWFALIAALLTSTGLAYAISNFGTLLRHREMIAISFALLPMICFSRQPNPLPEIRSEEAFAGERVALVPPA